MPREAKEENASRYPQWTLVMLQTSQLTLTLIQSRYIPETMLVTLFCKGVIMSLLLGVCDKINTI